MSLHAIPREHNISLGEFRRKYLATATPVVVSGIMEDWDAGLLNFSALNDLCGHGPVFGFCGDPNQSQLKYHAAGLDTKWASLGVMPRDDANLANLSQLLAAQQNGSFSLAAPSSSWLPSWLDMSHPTVHGPELYLHDSPLHHHCPALLRRLRSPKYFPVNLLQQLGPGVASHRADGCGALSIKPSLFIGAASSRSGLHVDAHGTRFWMGVLHGTKMWRLADPRSSAKLRRMRPTACDRTISGLRRASSLEADSRVYNELCPGMGADLFAPGGGGSGQDDDDGALEDAMLPMSVWEANVSAGELIFIPELWAHQVHNVDATIAISNNFVDDDSFTNYVRLADALLEFYKRAPSGSIDANAVGATARRLLKAGFARETPEFPWYSLNALSDDLPDANWDAYAENNAWRRSLGEAMTAEEHDAAFQAWIEGGGAARFLSALETERSVPWA